MKQKTLPNLIGQLLIHISLINWQKGYSDILLSKSYNISPDLIRKRRLVSKFMTSQTVK